MVQVLRPIVSRRAQAYRWDAFLGGVFLTDPSPYLHEFRRKQRKTPNGQVDKLDQILNLAPPVFQFLVLPLCHWLGCKASNFVFYFITLFFQRRFFELVYFFAKCQLSFGKKKNFCYFLIRNLEKHSPYFVHCVGLTSNAKCFTQIFGHYLFLLTPSFLRFLYFRRYTHLVFK